MEAGNQQQVVRIFVWRLIPSIFLLVRPRPMPRLLFLTGYFSFCCHEEGIPLQAILDNAESPWNLLALGMPYWMGMLYSNQPLWLHISWPGYRDYVHTVHLEHNGTCWSIALAIARAYESFLLEARGWEFSPYSAAESPLWQITGRASEPFHLRNFRLHRLWCVVGDVYQADIEIVV